MEIKIQLCEKEESKFLDKYDKREDWIAQEKLDGVRVVAIVKDGEVRIVGRKGNCYNIQLPKIVNALKKFPNCIIDGEVIANDFNFENIASIINTQDKLKIKLLTEKYNPVYYVFDILEYEGKDLRDKPLRERLEYLMDLEFEGAWYGDYVKMLEWTNQILELWDKIVKENKEGLILKDLDSKYIGKRSDKWLKVKNFKEAELVVNNYEVNNAGIIATDGTNRVQVAGSQSKEVKKRIDEQGKATISIQYLGKTKDNAFRFISFRGLK